jgi:hypothetical protein
MFREHKFEIAVFGIMAAISFAIALAVTGDFSDALAKASRR